jgi:hypothetical protein
MMNTMEDHLDNNTNDFKPTKELGDWAKYAAENTFGALNMWASIKKFTSFNDSTIGKLFNGTWTVKSDCIRLFSLCISRIRQKKVKLKKLPTTLPNREVMKSLELGLEENLFIYKKTIAVLCKMPDIASKMHKNYRSGRSGKRERIVLFNGEDFRTSSIYRQISAQNSSLYNNSPCSSDFDYGITDT